MGFRKPYTVKRVAAGSVIDGYYTNGTSSTVNITASVQPLKPSDIQQLPEGRRNKKLFNIFTSTKLNVVTSANPDKITIGTEDFELDQEEQWQNGILNHYKYLAIKV